MIEQFQTFLANPTWIDFMGILGSLLLAICALPEFFYTIRNKICRVPSGLLYIWFAGEVSAFVYVVGKGDFILTANYFCNIMLLTPCVYYNIKGK